MLKTTNCLIKHSELNSHTYLCFFTKLHQNDSKTGESYTHMDKENKKGDESSNKNLKAEK